MGNIILKRVHPEAPGPNMSHGFYQELDVPRIINARGYSTKLGGCKLPDAVLTAMRSASESCVRMEDLQKAASRVIAEATGAEAGIVTSGASAAVTLAAAACLTKLDISKMNRLPDTSDFPNEIILQRAHRNDYDHALRLAGARLVEAGFSYNTFPYDLECLITDRTVALFYLAGAGGLPFDKLIEVAHRHNLPVIVDAAAALPPPENLRSFIAAGADLVAFSGGKHIQGPQASGMLCGRKDLILAATLQHQDMDVFPENWPMRALIQNRILPGPPHHGIGRGFKVGKEEIAGLITALKLYRERDFPAEIAGWHTEVGCILSELADIAGVAARLVFPDSDRKPVPSAHVSIDSPNFTANDVINRLQAGDPPIAVYESLAGAGTIILYPEALQPGEGSIVGKALRSVLSGRG